MKTRLLLLTIFINCTLLAQQPLSESIRTSSKNYIYSITPREALTLYKTKLDKVNEKFLHTLIDSFPAGTHPPFLPAGNYLFFHAVNNSQRYELVTEGDVQLKTINNKRDLQVMLHAGNGSIIDDANVSAGRRQLVYWPATQTYGAKRFRRKRNISVLHEKTAYYFPMQRSVKRGIKIRNLPQKLKNAFPVKNITRTLQRWRGESNYYSYFDNPVQHERKFRGFMTFSKPIYKPGDTVRLKAFVMNKNGKGLNKPLLLRLTDGSFDFDTIIAVIKPYTKGGYLHEFVLNDSLDLVLDDSYLLTLEEEKSRKYDLNEYSGNLDDDDYSAKRKVVMRGNFEYEEYELQSINFSARTDVKEHNRGVPLSIYGKATDENDLPIMDGSLKVTVTPNFNLPVQTFSPFAFIPDTLWSHTIDLETIGETKIILPDSIFPPASLHYNIECVLLSSSNERQTRQLTAQYLHDEEIIQYELQGDSLHIDFQKRGISQPKTAMIYAFQNLDTILKQSINLPARQKINPYFTHYEVRTDSLNKIFHLKQTAGMVSALASRTADSLFISLSNPHQLPVWYSLWAGKRKVGSGVLDSLAINTTTKRNYFLTLHYLYGNVIQTEDYTIPYQDKLLKLTMNAPKVVYPGQKTTIEIDVKDARGRAVEGADVTAYGFTRKFTNARMPAVPYLGKIYPLRKPGISYTTQDPKTWLKESRLNWERWSREMNLDSIEYYRFLHPDSFYLNQEAVRSGLTQVAPFVVIGGELQPIHLLYIDEKPYFFSQSQHLKRYSFPVTAGKHSFRIRTHNRLITLKDVNIPSGVKTIISINGAISNQRISVQNASENLTTAEIQLINRYSILINNMYGERLSYIEQDHQLFPLPTPPQYGYLKSGELIGPLAPREAKLVVHGKYHQSFDVEGGYLHEIRQGLVKQKQVNTNIHIPKWLSSKAQEPNFSDFVLTAGEIDSLWQAYLDDRSATMDLFYHSELQKSGNGILQIQIKNPADSAALFIKNLFLFRYDDTDFTRVYRGNATNLGYLAPGIYRLIILLKEDRYIIQDSIRIRPGGVNYYQIAPVTIRPGDNISKRLAEIIHNRELSRRFEGYDLNTIRESYNTSFVDPGTFTNTVYGQVRDSEGNPIPSASVQVKGTRVSVLTDKNGYYKIKTPSSGTLVFSEVGFIPTEQPIRNNQMDIVLFAASSRLEEVVVTGYATKKRNFTASVATVQELQGRAPGVIIRGAHSISGSGAPLIVIDGVVYEGTFESLDPSRYGNITVLKPDVATALYGSRGVNGVILITTSGKKTDGIINVEGASTNSLRRRFRDDAFWQPSLKTDASGKARFTTTFPDDITNWRTFAIAIGGKKQTGQTEELIRSFRPISANLALPQFAVEGDSINAIGKVLNYGTDSIRLTRSIHINNHLVEQNQLHVRNSSLKTITLVVPEEDSIYVRMEIKKEDGYFDGEERVIPIYKKGTLETKGFFAALEGDTALTVQLDPALGKVTIYAEASLLPVLLDETEKVHRYPYLCNEQLASKLKALLAQKRIYELMKKSFDNDRSIRDIISRLQNNKTGHLWGWWINNEPSPWISLHVVESLLQAEKQGYKISLNRTAIIDQLVFTMEQYRSNNQILALQLLKQLGAKAHYKTYLDTLAKSLRHGSTYDKLRLAELQQAEGLPISIDSLLSTPKRTIFGNLYWGEEGHRFFDNSIQYTLLAYRILRSKGGHEATLAKIRNYFLEKRKDGQWRNTYESSLILETILPDLVNSNGLSRPATLSFGYEPGKAIIQFPYRKEVNADSPIMVSKQGDLPVYFTAYQQGWNKAPAAVSEAFKVNSFFESNKRTVTDLKAGEPVVLQVDIEVKGDADYVMIEIPIPSGCSYKDKFQPRLYNEVHREYFKDKVSIFCSSLKQGSYSFKVSLLPRYTGKFNLNPAKAEMMYFPVFYGREGMKVISIK